MNPTIRILSCFFPDAKKARGTTEIEEASGYSHERAHNLLKTMAKKGILSESREGNANRYRINACSADAFLAYVFYTEKRKSCKDFHGRHVEKAAALAHKCAGIMLLPSTQELVCISESAFSEENVRHVPPEKLANHELIERMRSEGVALSGIDFLFRKLYAEDAHG